MRKNDYSTWNWNYEMHQKATGFSYQVSSLIFFIAILVTMRLLSTLRNITVKLLHGQRISLVHMNKSVMFKMSLSCLELILMRNFIIFV